MKKEIPWELIISDLKQDISDADKKALGGVGVYR